MSEIHLSHSIDLPVPAERAWAVIADYPRDSEWREGVLSMTAEPPGPVRAGTVTVEHLRFGGKTYRNVGEVVAVEPGRALVWRTTEGADADGRRSVEPRGDHACRASLVLSVRPTGVERVLAPVLRRMLARNLRRDLGRLEQLVAEGTRSETDTVAATPSSDRP